MKRKIVYIGLVYIIIVFIASRTLHGRDMVQVVNGAQ